MLERNNGNIFGCGKAILATVRAHSGSEIKFFIEPFSDIQIKTNERIF